MRPHTLHVADDFWNIRGSFKIIGVVDIGAGRCEIDLLIECGEGPCAVERRQPFRLDRRQLAAHERKLADALPRHDEWRPRPKG